MSYRVPNFNLFCNIGPSSRGANTWPAWKYTGAPRLGHQECALVFGKRVNVSASGGTDEQGFPVMCMSLLLPALTDIRSMQSVNSIPDAVEVPEGSGRWYGVVNVDDIGKGYPNEHRTACIMAIIGSWVLPYA